MQASLVKIDILDTTLRDGEQAPGAAMLLDEKVAIAKMLEQLGVDVIEAGFAASSSEEIKAIQAISQCVKSVKISCLARALKKDIELASIAIKNAASPRIHVYIATSAIHLQHQLKMSQKAVLSHIESAIRFARNLCPEIEFSPMDATRTDIGFLGQAISSAIKAGASIINVTDTVGYALPNEFYQLIKTLQQNVYDMDKIILSAHCHNDLGLAVANSLAAIQAGARQVECTINGIGERAGNAALEEVVMCMHTRNDALPYTTTINTTLINQCSQLVSKTTGFIVQKNKAIVGDNAFVHTSGVHQDGMLKSALTYEVVSPKSVGKTSAFVFSKHSGRAFLKSKLQALDIALNNAEIDQLFLQLKKLSAVTKNISDDDILKEATAIYLSKP